jgi:hypothetical protein
MSTKYINKVQKYALCTLLQIDNMTGCSWYDISKSLGFTLHWRHVAVTVNFHHHLDGFVEPDPDLPAQEIIVVVVDQILDRVEVDVVDAVRLFLEVMLNWNMKCPAAEAADRSKQILSLSAYWAQHTRDHAGKNTKQHIILSLCGECLSTIPNNKYVFIGLVGHPRPQQPIAVTSVAHQVVNLCTNRVAVLVIEPVEKPACKKHRLT